MKNFRYLSILYATTVCLFTCCQSNSNSQAQTSSTGSTAPHVTVAADEFIKPLGIFAAIPAELVQIAEPNMLHLYSTDGNFEYILTWASSDQTPEKMRAALKVGTTFSNGFMHRSKGKSEMLGDKIEMTPFDVCEINTSKALFSGLEIHDWTSDRGVLVLTLMSRNEKESQLPSLLKSLHASIKIPGVEELQKIKAKINTDRKAGVKSKIETKYWNKVVGHTLLNRQYTGTAPMSKVEQRFELCESGKAKYSMINGAQFENVEGVWDIYETEDGIPLLVITDDKGEDNKWQIGPHISGNVTIGQAEFILHAAGTPDGPNWCSQE